MALAAQPRDNHGRGAFPRCGHDRPAPSRLLRERRSRLPRRRTAHRARGAAAMTAREIARHLAAARERAAATPVVLDAQRWARIVRLAEQLRGRRTSAATRALVELVVAK